jgi:hypothetical protein
MVNLLTPPPNKNQFHSSISESISGLSPEFAESCRLIALSNGLPTAIDRDGLFPAKAPGLNRLVVGGKTYRLYKPARERLKTGQIGLVALELNPNQFAEGCDNWAQLLHEMNSWIR